MKYKIVLVPFPFDDLRANKVRPAVCLTDEIKPHNHVVLAFITSNIISNNSATDLIIDSTDADFAATGLNSFFNYSPSPFDDNFQINHLA